MEIVSWSTSIRAGSSILARKGRAHAATAKDGSSQFTSMMHAPASHAACSATTLEVTHKRLPHAAAAQVC
eukprot:6558442-Prymnesium_polylepis.1